VVSEIMVTIGIHFDLSLLSAVVIYFGENFDWFILRIVMPLNGQVAHC